MRGQAYTVTNMLVWAAFAAAFLIAVLSAYNYLSQMTPPTYLRQIRDALSSAWEARYATIQRPVVLNNVHIPSGTIFDAETIKKWVGAQEVCFSVGPGFELGKGMVVVKSTITARVSVCCRGDTCWIGFNTLTTPTVECPPPNASCS